MLSGCLRAFRFGALFAAALLGVGCSGGGNVPAGGAGANGAVAASGGRTTTTLSITIPNAAPAAAAAANVRRPAYVSPATTSLTIVITGTGGTPNPAGYAPPAGMKVALTPTSTGCTSSLASTVCTLNLTIAPGTYTASVSTNDANNALLSQAQAVAFTVTAGAANSIPLTLGGIPVSIAVAPLTPGYLQGGATGLKLYGATTQTLIVNALDADNNVIVGPGAPAISAAASSSTVTVGAPTGTSPNTLTLAAKTTGTPAVVTPGSSTLTITVTPATGSGATNLVTNVPLQLAHSAVYVSLSSIGVYAYYDGNTSLQSVIYGNITNPEGIALDAFDELYIADYKAGSVTIYDAGSTNSARTLTGLQLPNGIAVDVMGDVYATSPASTPGDVQEFRPGSATSSTTYTAGINFPQGVAVDAAGTLYVTNPGAGSGTVTEYTLGTTPSVTITSGLDNPFGAAIEPSGALLVANNYGTNNLVEYLPGTTTPTTTTTYTGLVNPNGVAVDAAGTIFVAEQSSSVVQVYHHGTANPVATISLPNTPQFVAAYPLAVTR